MDLKICDTLCGQGKTSACINYINTHTDEKYLFVTPFLSETERIKNSCDKLNFLLPERDEDKTKLKDLKSLMTEGNNIACTHALFSLFTDEIKEIALNQKYTLVLDETIDVFEDCEISQGDVNFIMENNLIKNEDGKIVGNISSNCLNGAIAEKVKEVVKGMKSKTLTKYKNCFYFWSIPDNIFTCYERVFILTYLFEYSQLKYYLDINKIDYHLLGAKKENNEFKFCNISEMSRALDLRDKIHVFDNEKINSIGNEDFSLSVGWYNKDSRNKKSEGISQIRKNIKNYFRNILKAKSCDCMFTTYKNYLNSIKEKGCGDFVPITLKASNEYVNKNCLAYGVNLYSPPWMLIYLKEHGAENVNQDMLSLSNLIQWIFRSAIRKGEEIWIYIPSQRMRYLLTEWIENLANGEDLKPIIYPIGENNKAKAIKNGKKLPNRRRTFKKVDWGKRNEKRKKL